MPNKTMHEWASEFVLYKRNLGYKYITSEYYIFRYCAYSAANHPTSTIPCRASVVGFLELMSQTNISVSGFGNVLREFARFIHKNGNQQAYMLPSKRVPSRPPAAPPHFFTTQEIETFFSRCDEAKKIKEYPGREFTIPALFRLIYACGLRSSEARLLKTEDVNLPNNYFDIKDAKWGTSRRVFISDELSAYLNIYEMEISKINPQREYFFTNRHSKHYSASFIFTNFKKIWCDCFPDFPKGNRPRVIDFRHHFVWKNMNQWAEKGLDFNELAPYLMKYLGHKHLKSTLYYFHLVPEFHSKLIEMNIKTEDLLPEVGVYEY